MKIKIYICLLAILSMLAFPLVVFGEEIETFQYTSEVEIKENQDDFIMLEISPKVYDSINPGFKDLRLYHNEKELDYLVFPQDNQQRNVGEIKLDIFNKGTIGNSYSFEIVSPKDMNLGDIQYSVKLNLSQYLIKAKVYGSNDRKEWKYLKTQTIYGIDGEYNKFSLENIQYDFIRFEYDLLDNGDILEVNSVVYTQVDPIISKGVLHPVEFTSKEDIELKATEFLIDHQYNHYPTRGIILESEEGYFYREVIVSGSNGNDDWSDITRTFIFRDAVSEKLDINYGPEEYRYIRILIYNEDNQPLEISEIKTEVLPLYILANVSKEPETFTISGYWGNPSLSIPRYDITNLSIKLDPQLYKKYEIDSYVENQDFIGVVNQLPMTERFPWLMPGSLLLLTVGVSIFLYKTLKQVG